MARFITITLELRGVTCRARLLDGDAPATSQAVWEVLPQSGDAVHAKFARNEVYALLPRITAAPRRENPTVTPIPGDVCLFDFEAWEIGNPAFGYEPGSAAYSEQGATDLAIFYARNNLLINGDVGWVPGNVFGAIEEGLAPMAAACNDIWRNGFAGERLTFARA
ncbi:DUF3830 family protein [Occultella glacieicola]|uniref:DUF3830 family protein n=1 Tax=Occultella glacieicola TaxID=2518684 RepID=A0ABY2E4M9_9MICO|nr:DUF3830 family protein [Occultella glacieicola]TDE92798.1 DUF3830 family protein [Occultella glacieicola]